MDFNLARTNMVKSQLAPNRVRHSLLLETMLSIPRELFVAPSHREFAYSDAAVPLNVQGRRGLKPLQVALMIQGLGVKPGARVLVVGSGTGYESAVLAGLGAQVFALEPDPDLVARGEQLSGSDKIFWKVGDPQLGWPEEAPFDAVLFCGSVSSVPEKPIAQMSGDGVLVAVVGEVGDAVMSAVRIRARHGDRPEVMFETVVPPLAMPRGQSSFVL